MTSTRYIVGIDLGTTYSCAAVWKNGNVEIIPLENGARTMPSYVSFGDNEYIVGETAKTNISNNPINTIYDAKRFIGKSAADVCDKIDRYPFKIINQSNIPYFSVRYKGEDKRYSPEFISSLILLKIKEYASKYLECEVTDVIITVPAYFNDAQRSATIEAGKLAGLNVQRIINEPTAASLAYGLNKKIDKNVLVFDCGGGTHDVTILTITNGTFTVRATNGNTYLGGQDFDNVLFKYCVDDFNKKNGCDMMVSPKSIKKLKNVCEKVKRQLSEVISTAIEIDALYNGIDYITTITRNKFEELCCKLFDQTMEPVNKVLIDASMKNTDIDEIVLVGGSTRIPAIRERLCKYFGKTTLNESVNADEAVAFGAAVQGAIILDCDDSVKDIVMIDVTPLTLGVQSVGGLMAPVIKRNTTIPCCEKKKFTTNADNQTSVEIKVYQGERELTKDNEILGSFELKGIIPAKRGIPVIEVTFDVNVNGILCVSAVDLGNGNKQSITITGSHIKSQEEIDKMVNEATQFRDDDKKKKELISSVLLLNNYIKTIKDCIKTNNIEDSDNVKLNELFSYFNDNVDTITIENVNKIKNDIEDLWNPISQKIYNKT